MKRIDRRGWLLGTFALAMVRPGGLLATLSGCGAPDEPLDPVLRVPVAEIPFSGRIERTLGKVTVEFRREDGEIRARSMICSHQFCRVTWRPDEGNYLCPCDDGLFSADGSVLYGRAKRPLRELEVEIVGDEALVDTLQVYRAAPPNDGAR